ncbi:7562_t:CDS:2 [Ambispora gerdemannii]|uniref:7562_t:CDS:1 n=1 Tax=Ambispora gerdemannii TaxID=144530 RepID=A0A9N8VG33_9GLOM|nr:7562_t:CDS:2 [Ambispora gerdemannii]
MSKIPIILEQQFEGWQNSLLSILKFPQEKNDFSIINKKSQVAERQGVEEGVGRYQNNGTSSGELPLSQVCVKARVNSPQLQEQLRQAQFEAVNVFRRNVDFEQIKKGALLLGKQMIFVNQIEYKLHMDY